jgi:hypothetical protein
MTSKEAMLTKKGIAINDVKEAREEITIKEKKTKEGMATKGGITIKEKIVIQNEMATKTGTISQGEITGRIIKIPTRPNNITF